MNRREFLEFSVRTVCELADADATVEAMCVASGLKQTRVYAILRQHRPDRARQRRRPTSLIPWKVRGMAAPPHNIKPVRIAQVLGVTPAYVYRILSTG